MRRTLVAAAVASIVVSAAVAQTVTYGPPSAASLSGLAVGVATFLGTPSSANLATALTDETGTGAAVFGTSPTLTTKLTVSTGANNTVTVCQNPTATTYNILSLNGDCANATTQGLLSGATADAALYLMNKTGGSLSYRVNGAIVWTLDSAGKQTNGSIGDVPFQSSKLSTAALNKTDTTFATVTGLSMTLTAGRTYNCRGHLTVTAAPAGGGVKVTLATPDTLTVTSMSMSAANFNGTTTNARSTATALGSAIGAATATATDVDIVAGIVVNATGTLAVQAAQNAASGTTTIGQNSTFSCDRVS